MAYQLANSTSTVLINGTSVTDAVACSIVSFPSGSSLVRTITEADFQNDRGQALLSSLSNAVEQILGEGIAVAASGFQGLDAAGLLADYVRFTVGYTQPGGTAGEITADVDVPVIVVTADTSFGSFLTGGTAQERILDTYNKLQAMSSG